MEPASSSDQWRHAMRTRLSVLLVIAGALSSSWREAGAQQFCDAHIDVGLHYCLDPADCDPLALEVGGVVTLTLQVANSSDTHSGLFDPPAGVLQGHEADPPENQATFKIFYACREIYCFHVLPSVFTFNSATLLGPAVGNATFVDHGDGTGTLTIDNNIPYEALDTEAKPLVEISLTASTPPSGGMVFARAAASPAAFLITDQSCLRDTPPGTGQGTAVAQFAPSQPAEKDLEPCQRLNKQVIRIDTRRAGREYTASRVAFRKKPYDPGSEELAFGFERDGVPVFAFPGIPAGCFKLSNVRPLLSYQYDRACDVPGIVRARLQLIAPPDKWCLHFFAYAEFNDDLPSGRIMSMRVETPGVTFVGPKPPTYLQDATWTTIPAEFIPPQLASQWYLPPIAWKK